VRVPLRLAITDVMEEEEQQRVVGQVGHGRLITMQLLQAVKIYRESSSLCVTQKEVTASSGNSSLSFHTGLACAERMSAFYGKIIQAGA